MGSNPSEVKLKQISKHTSRVDSVEHTDHYSAGYTADFYKKRTTVGLTMAYKHS